MNKLPVFLEDRLRVVEDSGKLEYRSKALPTWCPGCGYFSVVEGVPLTMKALGLDPKNTVVVSGIGCSSRFPFFLNTYGFHTLHGRALPVATGVKVANESLNVIAVGGDGDGFAIGGGHVPHAARRNVDMTYLLLDNGIYGLTKGQTSPTSALGLRTPTTPFENLESPLNPLLMVLSYGATWVGQASAGRPEHLYEMLRLAVAHRGFSYLHVLSPCVTFDKTSRTCKSLEMTVHDIPKEHDPHDLSAAMAIAMHQEVPTVGLLYETTRPTLGDVLNTVIDRASGAPAKH